MITIYNQGTKYKLNNRKAVVSVIRDVLRDHNREEDKINIILTTDDYLHSLNLTYLKHDYLTDILTFSYKEGSPIEADIFISIERAMENATTHNVSLEEELNRLMIHGILHCCGHNDDTISEKEKMRHSEEHYLEQMC